MTQSAINNNIINHQTQETLKQQIRPIVEHFLKTASPIYSKPK